MEEILRSVWIQGGAIGLLIFSGYYLWWLERQERIRVQAKKDELTEKLLVFMESQKELVQDLVDGLDVKEMLRNEIIRNDRRRNG